MPDMSKLKVVNFIQRGTVTHVGVAQFADGTTVESLDQFAERKGLSLTDLERQGGNQVIFTSPQSLTSTWPYSGWTETGMRVKALRPFDSNSLFNALLAAFPGDPVIQYND